MLSWGAKERIPAEPPCSWQALRDEPFTALAQRGHGQAASAGVGLELDAKGEPERGQARRGAAAWTAKAVSRFAK
eukprot:6491261-Prymnesium_polylepis.1